MSSLSPLTPLQRYQEARRQYEANLVNARANDINAISNFGALRDAFLEASRIINGSNGQYNTDFFGSFNEGASLTAGAVRPYTAADGIANTAQLAAVIAEGNAYQRDVSIAVADVGRAMIENADENSVETNKKLQATVDVLERISSGGMLTQRG